RTHDDGDLGDTHCAHPGVVAKNAAEMFFIGEDLILHGEEDAGAVDKIDYRQMIFHGDLLQTEVFFAGDGEPGAGLYGLVVCEDHALSAADIADPGYGAAGGTATLFFVHFEPGKGADLDKWRSFIDEVLDPFASRELVLFPLALDRR